ncbi:hypothetical protein [Arthrobacter tumbae]|uniref:hypothetical protein n=1 Tax=Arthrobacter tumbae TaxID=163874 RepID=UPI00195D10CD|nr:hypothetical protein [Arthrobacter tumbae]MBM7780536.1 hypothetical protein [Arthrobacter tumbae]
MAFFVIFLASMVYPLVFLQQDWLGWFPATMSSFLLSTVFGSLTVCTSAAWLAGSVRRSGLSEWTAASARGVSGVYSRPIIVCALLACVAYTTVFATMFLMTAARAPGQVAQYPELVLVLPIACASAVAWAGVGAALGRFVRSEAAIPLALIVSYASYIVPAFYLWDSPFFGVMLADGRPWVYLQPEDLQLPVKLLSWCGLAAFFTAIAVSGRRMLAVGASLGIAGLTAAAILGSALTPIPGAEARACLGEAPRVCTDQAHAAVLPQFHAMTAEALAILPASLRPRELDNAAQPEPGVLPLAPMDGNTNPAMTIDRDLMIASLGEQIFYQCSPNGGRNGLVPASLYAWWRIEHGISLQEMVTFTGAPWLLDPALTEAPSKGQELAALPPAERETWFEENTPYLTDCAHEKVVWP